MAKTIKQRFIIDASGSMLDQKETVITGFNEQLESMQIEERKMDVRYLVSLTTFSLTANVVYMDVPLAQVPKLTSQTYLPWGGTALYDAIGQTIDTAEPGETDIIVTIMTDGRENASTKWKKSTIKVLTDIRIKENKWGFVYFGANQNAWAEAQQMGINNALTYDVRNTGMTMDAMSSVRSCYVSTATSGTYDTSNLTASVNAEDLIK